MAVTFQIYNLDMQARVHYAPNDSESHIAEKLMCSLNEHAGSGKTIKLPEVELTELEDISTLLNMTSAELQSLKARQEETVSKICASLVASNYQGKPWMGTSIDMKEHQILTIHMKFSFWIILSWRNVI